jgi:signal transduction histidine kinase
MIWMLGRIPLRPVEILVERMERLTRGDYKVRITVSDNPNQYSNMKKIADGFNMLAEELENTEMLRQDFVNNFSHEFKTPINSIAGFAKLMKKKKLTDEQKEEYLSIIEEESLRLSSMATKVLNLTKVENQRILSGIDLCNVSEQLRKTILLSQNRWTEKNLKFEINFEEHFCEGNEELLKQVWINLIDNAIKFSPNDGRVSLDIKEKPECIEIIIANQGEEFTEEMKKHVFRKFYQGDQSHASEGNGIGLAIVKRVLELHHGSVVVSCANGMIIFNVKLPKKQKSFD